MEPVSHLLARPVVRHLQVLGQDAELADDPAHGQGLSVPAERQRSGAGRATKDLAREHPAVAMYRVDELLELRLVALAEMYTLPCEDLKGSDQFR